MSKSWTSTLRLPKSTFPPRPLAAQRDQYLRRCTDELYQWQAASRHGATPFVIHDGPPYANGSLHVGHALNKILKDMIVRTKIQQGRRVKYVPGWDCHGLPIELKALGEASAAKHMTATQVRKSARALASETILQQMKSFRSFGVIGDWENRWSTMDPSYEISQLRLFQKMVERGLIYRKHKPVYWSPSSGTALAEAELEYNENHISTAAYIKFLITTEGRTQLGLDHLEEELFAVIWTTTPWTLPANRAIGVHNDLEYCVVRSGRDALLVATTRLEDLKSRLPEDASFDIIVPSIKGSDLKGVGYINKLRGKQSDSLYIISADFVSANSGTGLVHLAPGHGFDDYDVCLQHGIEVAAPVDDDGFFTAQAYPDDPKRLTSAPDILSGGSSAVLDLLAQDVIHTHKYTHKYPYDWRTKKPIIIRATAQWFANVASIKEDALASLDNVHFIPQAGRTRLESFVRGRNEWCISRQRAWGVPIPVLYDQHGNAVASSESVNHIISVIEKRGIDAWFSDDREDPAWVCPSLTGQFRRGMDTMDVWFDSGSSWSQTKEQADVYLEGSDQHRGWFQSSLLTRVAALRDEASGTASSAAELSPFRTLVTHGFTLDQDGKKMSKSLGNIITPEQVMDGTLLPPIKLKGKAAKEAKGKPPAYEALGPDALRLWVASSEYARDVAIGESVLKAVHSSLVKYRTITKMLLGSLHKEARDKPLTTLDQIALIQLRDVMDEVSDAFDRHEFYRAVSAINRWVSNELSAFYLEALKDRLYCGDGGGVLEPIFFGFLRMLAPITPLLVEEAWDHRPEWFQSEYKSLEFPGYQPAEFPVISKSRLRNDEPTLRKEIPVLMAVREAIQSGLESARNSKQLGSSLQCSVIISADDDTIGPVLTKHHAELDTMFVVSSVDINTQVPDSSAWSHQREFEVSGSRGSVYILPPKEHKCQRCWRYLAHEEEGLCSRCHDLVQ